MSPPLPCEHAALGANILRVDEFILFFLIPENYFKNTSVYICIDFNRALALS